MESFVSGIEEEREESLQYPQLGSSVKKNCEAVVDDVCRTDIRTDALVHHLEDENTQREYLEKKEMILQLLDGTKELIGDLQALESSVASIRYPLNQSENDETSGRHDMPLVNFRVLKLELKSPGKNFGQEVLYSLNNESLTKLLDNRFSDALKHLAKIKARVNDTFSKVLITGDLNSGKSTFINSLLRRDILPHDQQPCTTMFCEVLSSAANHGEEGVHGLVYPSKYDVDNLRTYTKFNLDHIKNALTEDQTQYNLWKVYCNENRPEGQSLLNNGIVNLVLIDSPGLNRDVSQTMAVFSQHEEIDAVIFVVNAENHFTLSGVEFLTEARKEKPHMFVVVNRFDLISDKNRCRMNILKQIQDLLPKTAENSDELVHFVSAREYLKRKNNATNDDDDDQNYSFLNLESCLRSFLLEKRARTKLGPAKIYLTNILHDVNALAAYNESLANSELSESSALLEKFIPEFARLTEFSEKFEHRLEKTITDSLQLIQLNSQLLVDRFSANIGDISRDVSYPGIFGLWGYADAIVRNANTKLLAELERHETEIHMRLTQDIKNLWVHPLENLPGWVDVAGPLDAHLPPPLPRIVDIREQQHLIKVQVEMADFMEIPSNLGTVATFVGATSIVGAGIIGYRRVISGLYHVGTLAGADNVTRVFWGSVAVIGLATAAYVLHDAPNTVQRKIVRKIRRSVKKSDRMHKRLHRSGYYARKTLEKSSFEFKKGVHKIIELKESECSSEESRKAEALKNKRYFEGLKQRSFGLLEVLDSLNVDDLKPRIITTNNNNVVDTQ